VAALRWPLLLAVLVATAALAGCTRPRGPDAGEPTALTDAQEGPTVEMRLELGKDRYAFKELMIAKVVLQNTGTATEEVPRLVAPGNAQPRYTVTGPSFAGSFTFPAVPPGRVTATEPLAPGATLETKLQLESLVPFTTPGVHTIVATAEYDGHAVRSAPVAFTVDFPAVLGARLMLDDGAQGRNPIRAVVLAQAGDTRPLYQALLAQARPDIPVIALSNLLPLGQTPAGADEPLEVWTNFPRGNVFFQRYGWSGPAAITMEGRATLTFALAAPARAVHPALMPQSGEADVFTVGGGEASLVRFPLPAPKAPPPAAQRMWTARVGEVLAARATLGPPAAGSPRALVLLQKTPRGAALTLLVSDAAAAAAPSPRSASIDFGRLLPATEPAVHVLDDGTVQASVVLAEDTLLRRLFVADVRWPRGGGAPHVERSPAMTAPSTPRAAATAYSVGEERPARREWVVLLEGDRVVSGRSPDAPLDLEAHPVLPLQILSLSDGVHLLVAPRTGAVGLALVQ